jgi:hypothetical protein
MSYKDSNNHNLYYFADLDLQVTATNDLSSYRSLVLEFAFTLPSDFPSDVQKINQLILYLYHTSVSEYLFLIIRTDMPDKIFSTPLEPNATLSFSLIFPMLQFDILSY